MAKFHVAVVGAGIGGATFARALLKFPEISFTLYDSKAEPAEQGAAVSLANSALQSLSMIGVDVDALLKHIGGVPYSSVTTGCGNGPEALDAKPNTMEGAYQVNVSRTKLLQAILTEIPNAVLETNKKLIKVEQWGQSNVLSFADGTTSTADAVVGFDGIHSTIRRIILGSGHPAVAPVYAGFWWTHNTLEYDSASRLMSHFEIPKGLLSLYGQDGFLMCLCINNGTDAVPYAIGMSETWDQETWSQKLSAQEFRAYFKQWNEVSQDVVEMVAQQPEITIHSEWESAVAPAYTKGSMCMAGDAAHAPVPWGAHGAAMSIEDSLVLSRLLAASTAETIPKAFQTYEKLRIGRTQAIVRKSREIGHIFCGKVPKVGLDAVKMAPLLMERAMFMRGIDMQAHVEEAIALLSKA